MSIVLSNGKGCMQRLQLSNLGLAGLAHRRAEREYIMLPTVASKSPGDLRIAYPLLFRRFRGSATGSATGSDEFLFFPEPRQPVAVFRVNAEFSIPEAWVSVTDNSVRLPPEIVEKKMTCLGKTNPLS